VNAYVVRLWTEDQVPFRDAQAAPEDHPIMLTIGKIRRQLHDLRRRSSGSAPSRRGLIQNETGPRTGAPIQKSGAACGAALQKEIGAPCGAPERHGRRGEEPPAERLTADEGDGAGGRETQGQEGHRGDAVDETFEVGDSCESHNDTHL